MLRRIFTILLVILTAFITGCSQAPVSFEKDSLTILCTGFAQYDWVKNIVGDSQSVEVSLLQKGGVDIHSYQPSAEDIVRISNCDMLVLTGGISDKSIIDIADSSDTPSLIIFNMMEELNSSLLCAEHEGEHHMHELDEYDEHIWLSLKNAEKLCLALKEKIIFLDPASAEIYNSNTSKYISDIKNLDREYQKVTTASRRKTLVFADRFPFAYLANDYSLECFSAFSGCSSETDASFDTILSLAEKIDGLGLKSVLTIDGGISNIDESVISNTKSENIKTLSLESLQSVALDEINAGLSYLSAMTDNLNVLKEALN